MKKIIFSLILLNSIAPCFGADYPQESLESPRETIDTSDPRIAEILTRAPRRGEVLNLAEEIMNLEQQINLHWGEDEAPERIQNLNEQLRQLRIQEHQNR